jgi:hypothetical protein
LISDWAYMVIAAPAWNLKAWYGLVTEVSLVYGLNTFDNGTDFLDLRIRHSRE